MAINRARLASFLATGLAAAIAGNGEHGLGWRRGRRLAPSVAHLGDPRPTGLRDRIERSLVGREPLPWLVTGKVIPAVAEHHAATDGVLRDRLLHLAHAVTHHQTDV